ncbi:MAG: hydantoinase/oxoprolinase N-terminal domain-containing protein [Caldilineaceae bacterium]
MSNVRLAIDVGGTFVDFVRLDESSGRSMWRRFLPPARWKIASLKGWTVSGLAPRDVAMIVHGSTLVINTIVQEKGARVGLITTAGFRDVLELGRGNRAEIYNLFYTQPAACAPFPALRSPRTAGLAAMW